MDEHERTCYFVCHTEFEQDYFECHRQNFQPQQQTGLPDYLDGGYLRMKLAIEQEHIYAHNTGENKEHITVIVEAGVTPGHTFMNTYKTN